ncbi:hypothetical protein GCM10022202_13330 [Microbacterium marinilacus]|uniref:Uncharacterized protein n=1 Tax=Microbacterium marinilacus TaxID=415209 RepID=A0ABP7BBR3_9MICO
MSSAQDLVHERLAQEVAERARAQGASSAANVTINVDGEGMTFDAERVRQRADCYASRSTCTNDTGFLTRKP